MVLPLLLFVMFVVPPLGFQSSPGRLVGAFGGVLGALMLVASVRELFVAVWPFVFAESLAHVRNPLGDVTHVLSLPLQT
ncbi:hypothetical protein BN1263330012 [Stenotrophomonas thermophila]|nr:hypothetical protein BN1263330012 [Stenotrophomonas maltophilia]